MNHMLINYAKFYNQKASIKVSQPATFSMSYSNGWLIPLGLLEIFKFDQKKNKWVNYLFS